MNRAVRAFSETIKRFGENLLEYPRLGRAVESGWSLYMRSHFKFTEWRKCHLNVRGANVDPYRIVWVDPDRIEYVTAHSFPKAQFKHAGDVVGGDWDRLEKRFEETDFYRAFDAHFNDGVAWEDTDFFDRIVTQIANGRTRWDCTSRREFEDRCRRLDELYDAIDANGYRSQRELTTEDVDNPIENSQYPAPERFLLDEITVNIGRDGDLLFYDGRNRLSIAKLLDVDEVPVWILVRHAKWQELRNDVAAGEFDDLPVRRTHPDLRSL